MRKLVVAILLLCVSCDSEEPQHGFSIAAPEQYAGATLFLDGQPVARMEHLGTHGGAVEALLKGVYGDSPALRVVVAGVDFSERRLSPGRHTLRVEKAGVPTAQGEFTYPFGADDEWQVFFVNGTAITAPE
jgi:hypothetical protein